MDAEEREVPAAHAGSSAGARLLRGATSVPSLTLLILILVDVWLRQGNPLDALGFRTVDLWNLPPRIELCRKAHPDVALVGSSLLLVLNQDERGAHFYSGVYPPLFQAQLRKTTAKPVTCINLCTGLQMPSEAFLIAEAVAASPDPPPVIIYGLALRDFIHDQYALEWTCDSFASIAPYAPLSPAVLGGLTSFYAAREFTLCHVWYLYRNRIDFKDAMSAVVKDALENLPLDISYTRLGADHQWRPQRRGFLLETWVPRQQEHFTESVYRERPEFLKLYYGNMQAGIYKQGSMDTMRAETHYLARMIELCREKEIKLVLVNMPLSPEFQMLVPGGLYDAFSTFLKQTSEEQGVALIDLYSDKEFGSDSFKDGVHLSYDGAVMLADKLTRALKDQHPEILSAISAHASLREGAADRVEREAAFSR